MSLAIVLLAAGHGSRMKSKKQKVLHHVGGKPMFLHVFEAVEKITDVKPVVVIAPNEDGIPQLVGNRATFVYQEQRLGTGHATLMAQPILQGQTEQVLVTYGDMPLLQAHTMEALARRQTEQQCTLSLLTVTGLLDTTFGRIRRDVQERVVEIIEVAEAKKRPNCAELLAIPELNVGIYCFDAHFLWKNLSNLPLRQARGGVEYYLTDMVDLAVQQGLKIDALVTSDVDECMGAGTRAELVQVEKAFQRRINHYWLDNGVTLVDPQTIYIDNTVQIGQDTIIYPNSYLRGQTVIGADCVIGPNVVIDSSYVPDNTTILPFTHLQGE